MKKIGDKIKVRRRLMEISQKRLAEGITSQPTISRLESGDFKISVNEFMLVLDRLNMSAHDTFCSREASLKRVVQEKLDEMRNDQDYEGITEILNTYDSEFWAQSPELEAYKYWHLGLMKQHKEDYRTALRLIDRAIEKHTNNENMYESVAEMHLTKGIIYNKMGIDGLDSYKEAEYYYNQSGEKSFKLSIKILYNVIISLCQSEEYETSLKYCDKGLYILKENESTYLICQLLYMKMSSLLYMKRYEEYTALSVDSKIYFKTFDKLNLLVKLENYSRENI